jgi:hypothetical protein
MFIDLGFLPISDPDFKKAPDPGTLGTGGLESKSQVI